MEDAVAKEEVVGVGAEVHGHLSAVEALGGKVPEGQGENLTVDEHLERNGRV